MSAPKWSLKETWARCGELLRSIRPERATTDNHTARLPSGRSWDLGLAIPLPIYNRNQGNIARALGNLSQTQCELAALERRVVSEVRQAPASSTARARPWPGSNGRSSRAHVPDARRPTPSSPPVR
jgi:hypothetical protein